MQKNILWRVVYCESFFCSIQKVSIPLFYCRFFWCFCVFMCSFFFFFLHFVPLVMEKLFKHQKNRFRPANSVLEIHNNSVHELSDPIHLLIILFFKQFSIKILQPFFVWSNDSFPNCHILLTFCNQKFDWHLQK